jgi:peptide/nickel transport system substrate-binding protein
MNNKYWMILVITLVLLLALLLPACARQAPAPPAATPPAKPAAPPATPATPAKPQPQIGGVLKIITSGEVGALGAPAEAVGGSPTRNFQPALEYLLRYDAKLNLQPRLVESWEIAPDGKAITLRLYKGIKFHDGTDFNAEAVKYNLANYAPSNIVPAVLQNVTSYDVVDPYTLRLNLKAFDCTLLYEFAGSTFGMMASPTAMKLPTTPENMAKDHLVGTGPFKFVSFKRSDNIKYARFEGYWQKGKPYLDGVEFLDIADPVTAILALKKGEAHLIYRTTPTDAVDFEKAGFKIVVSGKELISSITPDGANADSPWGDRRVRQAADYAIDKKALGAAMGLGYYEPISQMVTPRGLAYVPGLAERTYNPDKAKQLLAEAGYTTGFKTTFYAQANYSKDVLVAIQTYFKAVGIDATIEIKPDSASMWALANKGWKNGLLFTPGFDVNNIADVARCFRATGTGTLFQLSAFRPPGWQDKLDATQAQVDYNKRTTQLQEINKIMVDEAMIIPLWISRVISAQDKRVQDLQWSEGGLPHFYEIQDAWLSK